jgi:hypothetical protein
VSTTTQTTDQAKFNEFLGRFLSDLGAALSAALVVIGDKLGLYRASTSPLPPRSLPRGPGPTPTEGGFSRVRRAVETPFNVVLEARP